MCVYVCVCLSALSPATGFDVPLKRCSLAGCLRGPGRRRLLGSTHKHTSPAAGALARDDVPVARGVCENTHARFDTEETVHTIAAHCCVHASLPTTSRRRRGKAGPFTSRQKEIERMGGSLEGFLEPSAPRVTDTDEVRDGQLLPGWRAGSLNWRVGSRCW